MSLWIKENENDEDISYYSIRSLQQEAKLHRTNYKLMNEPNISDMTKCFFCKATFNYLDTINFYSDTSNEYCYHQDCSWGVYRFDKKNLIVSDLQDIINMTWDIDYSHDNIIPANIYKLNLIQKYKDYNLDFSQSNLKELSVSDYDMLDSDNFKSIIILKCYRTLVDFTKFINLNNLSLSRPLNNIVLSSCKNLTCVALNDINYNIDFTDCINLNKLTLKNINAQLILKNCINLEECELNNVTTLIDVSDCIKLQLLRIENMMIANIPKNISSLTKLHIYNIYDYIDIIGYPNLKTISNNIYNNGKGEYGKCIVNYDKLEHLEVFVFSDVRFIHNNPIVYNFDFSKNTKLKNLNIYSAINNCNININNNINLEDCTLEFYSDNPIIIPKTVKNLKYKKDLNIIHSA
jgi:hypothetical protein